MSAAETIAAAIEKLERERKEATPGEWYVTYEKSRWPRVWGNRDETDADAVAQTEGGAANARLIVTLHRAIDPVLAILRTSLSLDGLVPMDQALDLARAILGEVA
jgi:hypothetical protein